MDDIESLRVTLERASRALGEIRAYLVNQRDGWEPTWMRVSAVVQRLYHATSLLVEIPLRSPEENVFAVIGKLEDLVLSLNQRIGALVNPRPLSPEEVEHLLRRNPYSLSGNELRRVLVTLQAKQWATASQ